VNTNDDQQIKELEAKVCELEEIRKHESFRFSLESIASDVLASPLMTTSKFVLISWAQQYLN
jgi:hypothetical protein